MAGRSNALRRTADVLGAPIAAPDGAAGRVRDFFIDTRYWVIRYLEVVRLDRPAIRTLLIHPNWIDGVNWEKPAISVGLTREALDQAPVYDPSGTIDRHYEARLFNHYGYPVYWQC